MTIGSHSENSQSEIRRAVKYCPEIAYFIPKDQAILDRYRIGDLAIQNISFYPASLRSSILSRMVLSYCKDKTDPRHSTLPKFSPDFLESIVKKLIKYQFIQSHSYPSYIHPIAVFGVCEEHLQKASKDPYEIEAQLEREDTEELDAHASMEHTDNFRCVRNSKQKIKKLACILFTYLSITEKAKIKADSDKIAFFLRIYEKIPSLHAYRIDFSKIYQKQLEGMIDLDILELNLNNTHIETIAPEIFSQLSSLKKLSFAGNQSDSLSMLSLIAQLTNLEELDLSHNAFTCLPPSFFSGLNKLKTIHLQNNQFPAEELSRISAICQEKGIVYRI